MGWQAPPVVVDGDPLTAETWNAVVDDLVVLGSYLPMFAVGGAADGTDPPNPADGPVYLFQGGSATDVVLSSGAGRFEFPTPFPNGFLSGWAMPQAGSYTSIQIRPSQSSAAVMDVVFQPTTSGASTGNMQWGAIGW